MKNLNYEYNEKKIKNNRKANHTVFLSVKKLYFLIIFTCILIVFLMFLNTKSIYGSTDSESSSKQIIGFESVLVLKGDSLYSLAVKRNSSFSFDEAYIEQFIRDVSELNDLDESSKIYAGGYLLLPKYK